jgi:hypothetical protein
VGDRRDQSLRIALVGEIAGAVDLVAADVPQRSA